MDSRQTPSSANGAPTYTERTDPASRTQHGDMSHIPGWGADLDRRLRPAVPMERTPPRLDNAPGAPAQQAVRVEVLHSIERPGITPVFGSTVPPAGLSGGLRRLAFRYSENDVRHWMILLLADRVDVGEGLVSDLARGHVPNLPAEMGARAEWRHNRGGFVRKALVLSAVAALACYALRQPARAHAHVNRW